MTQTHITIKRPAGNVETVIKDGNIPEPLRRQMEVATRNAGRGEIIGWKVVETKRGHVCDTDNPQSPCCWSARSRELAAMRSERPPMTDEERDSLERNRWN